MNLSTFFFLLNYSNTVTVLSITDFPLYTTKECTKEFINTCNNSICAIVSNVDARQTDTLSGSLSFMYCRSFCNPPWQDKKKFILIAVRFVFKDIICSDDCLRNLRSLWKHQSLRSSLVSLTPYQTFKHDKEYYWNTIMQTGNVTITSA